MDCQKRLRSLHQDPLAMQACSRCYLCLHRSHSLFRYSTLSQIHTQFNLDGSLTWSSRCSTIYCDAIYRYRRTAIAFHIGTNVRWYIIIQLVEGNCLSFTTETGVVEASQIICRCNLIRDVVAIWW